MRIVLKTFLVSTVASLALWEFGLAYAIWPTHPFLATLGIAAACGIAVQLHLSRKPAPRNF